MKEGVKMRASDFIEKRRFERLNMSLPITLKHVSDDGKEKLMDGVTSDVSYDGAFVTDAASKDLKPNDNLHVSLVIPRDNTRDFPFSRLTGKARIARIEEAGIALEFNERMSRLFVAI